MLRDRLIQAVRERRRALGWTQGELAAVLGSSPSRISKLETADPSVSLDLVARALDAMNTELCVEVDPESDIADPALDEAARARIGRELLRRQLAKRIAADAGVDEGDVRNVLLNLELSPLDRLANMFRRATLKRHAVH